MSNDILIYSGLLVSIVLLAFIIKELKELNKP
jgi:hypothetical protein